MKKTSTPIGDFDGQMQPVESASSRKASSSFCSSGDMGYTFWVGTTMDGPYLDKHPWIIPMDGSRWHPQKIHGLWVIHGYPHIFTVPKNI
jgi:hypothetical protein